MIRHFERPLNSCCPLHVTMQGGANDSLGGSVARRNQAPIVRVQRILIWKAMRHEPTDLPQNPQTVHSLKTARLDPLRVFGPGCTLVFGNTPGAWPDALRINSVSAPCLDTGCFQGLRHCDLKLFRFFPR